MNYSKINHLFCITLQIISLLQCIIIIKTYSWPIGFGGNARRTSQVIPTDTLPSSTIHEPYEIWKKETGSRIESSVSLNIEASKDPLGYIANTNGQMICFHLISGAFSWVVSTSAIITSSPLIFQDTVYISNSQRIYAINKMNGRTKYTIKKPVISSPVISNDGKFLIFGDMDGNIYGAIDGKIIWTYKVSAGIYSSPAISYDDKTVVFGSDDKFVYALNVNTGTFKWKTETESVVRSSPAISTTGNVYIGSGFGDGNLYCLKLSDGKIKWKYQTGNGISSSPSISSDNTKVFVGSSDNYIYALDAFNSHLLWKVKTEADVESSPALSEDGSVLYQGSNDGHIYAIEIESGNIRFKYYIRNAITSSIALSRGGEIMFFGSNTVLYSIGSGRLNQYGEFKQDESVNVDL